jgi:hypothetical protein
MKIATVPTRKPVKATGLKIRVAYFTTTKLDPQIVAIASSNTSVTPNAGCDDNSAIATGGLTDSVIAEN